MIATKPLPGATIDYQHPLSRGLIGWWLFNEGAGSRVADISGNGIHGTATNIDLTTAWRGTADGGGLETDGDDDEIVITNSPVTNSDGEVSVFIRGMNFDFVNVRNVISHWGVNGNRAWRFWTTGVGRSRLGLAVFDDGSGGAGHQKQYVTSASFMPAFDGALRHVGFVFLNGDLRLFVDGNKDPNPDLAIDDPITTIFKSTGDIHFGSRDADLFSNFRFSDVRIYNRALHDSEVMDLFVNPYAGLMD